MLSSCLVPHHEVKFQNVFIKKKSKYTKFTFYKHGQSVKWHFGGNKEYDKYINNVFIIWYEWDFN